MGAVVGSRLDFKLSPPTARPTGRPDLAAYWHIIPLLAKIRLGGSVRIAPRQASACMPPQTLLSCRRRAVGLPPPSLSPFASPDTKAGSGRAGWCHVREAPFHGPVTPRYGHPETPVSVSQERHPTHPPTHPYVMIKTRHRSRLMMMPPPFPHPYDAIVCGPPLGGAWPVGAGRQLWLTAAACSTCLVSWTTVPLHCFPLVRSSSPPLAPGGVAFSPSSACSTRLVVLTAVRHHCCTPWEVLVQLAPGGVGVGGREDSGVAVLLP